MPSDPELLGRLLLAAVLDQPAGLRTHILRDRLQRWSVSRD